MARLSAEQKKELISIYFESHLYKLDEDLANSLNSRLNALKIPFNITKTTFKAFTIGAEDTTEDAEVLYQVPRDKLMSLIFKHGSGKEFYQTLKDIYYNYHSPDATEGPISLSLIALKLTISDFHECETKHSEKKARWLSLLFCLPVVTIPFVKPFYNYLHKQFAKGHFFDTFSVDYTTIQAQPTEKAKNDVRSYGVMNKLLNRFDPNMGSRLDGILFNTGKNNGGVKEFRKFCSEDDTTNSLKFLGTKGQIERSRIQFSNKANNAKPATPVVNNDNRNDRDNDQECRL